jgi:hypothetical protein
MRSNPFVRLARAIVRRYFTDMAQLRQGEFERRTIDEEVEFRLQ